MNDMESFLGLVTTSPQLQLLIGLGFTAGAALWLLWPLLNEGNSDQNQLAKKKNTTPIGAIKSWFGVRSNSLLSNALVLSLVTAFTVLFLMAIGTTFLLLGRVLSGANNPGSESLGLGALLVALLSAPFLLWRSIVAQRTLDAQLDANITDRISKAVEQLGSENDAVRMGGVLALERLLRDAPNDKERIRVTLNAFLEYRAATLKKGSAATIDMEAALSVLLKADEGDP